VLFSVLKQKKQQQHTPTIYKEKKHS